MSKRLEYAFERIQHERMAGLPIINPCLRVQTVGFRPWQDLGPIPGPMYDLGILITPWFMNLLQLPSERQTQSALTPGDTQIHHLPSGAYEFSVVAQDAVGCYLSCPLFSPMSEFSDQAMAVDVAESILSSLLEPAPDCESTTQAFKRRAFLRGCFSNAADRCQT